MSICTIYFGMFLSFLVMSFFSSIYFMIIEDMSINSKLVMMTILLDWMSLLFISFVLFL